MVEGQGDCPGLIKVVPRQRTALGRGLRSTGRTRRLPAAKHGLRWPATFAWGRSESASAQTKACGFNGTLIETFAFLTARQAVTGKNGRDGSTPGQIIEGLTLRNTSEIVVDRLPHVEIQIEAEST